MKVNWKKKVASALLAAGIFVPGVAQGVDIPLGDPSFEAYDVFFDSGYAYANLYRPTSAWIGNPGDAGGPEDGGPGGSNWLYDSLYAEGGTNRGAPSDGLQAMHGRGHYSGQESSAVFEAGKTYTFSIFAQGDDDSNNNFTYGWDSRVWLYIYDGSIPYSEANSLTLGRYSPIDVLNPGPDDFVNRDPSWTAEQSQAAWQEISISWTVEPGAPEIGHPVGVAFWAGDDAGLDQASLSVLSALLAGDGNGDGKVDGLDYLLWAGHFGDDPADDPPGSPGNGDYNDDGVVDGLDYLVWAGNFGAGASAGVPEPASLSLLVLGCATIVIGRRSNRKR